MRPSAVVGGIRETFLAMWDCVVRRSFVAIYVLPSPARDANVAERVHVPKSLSLTAWGPVILGCSFQEQRSECVGYASVYT